MLFLQKFSYLFILVIISIISSCHLLGNPRFDIKWKEITMKEISSDILKLQKDLNEAKGEIEKLKDDIKSLEGERDSLKGERDRLKKDKESLNQQLEKLTNDLEKITKAKEKADEDIESKDGKIKDLEKEVEDLKKDKLDLEIKKGDLEREKSNLEGSNNEKNTQIAKLREEIKEKLREIDKKEAEKEDLKREKQKIIDGLKEDLKKIKREKEELNNNINSLKEQLRKKDENDGFDNFKNIVEKREREDSYTYKDFKKFKGELKNLSIWRKSLITDYNKNINNTETVKNELINGSYLGATNDMFKKRDILGVINQRYVDLAVLEEALFRYMINIMKESFDFIKNKDNDSRINNRDFYWEVKRNNSSHYARFYAFLSNMINYIYHNKLKGNRDYRKLPYTNLELKEMLSRFTKILVYHFPTIYDFVDFLFEDTDKYFE